MPLSSIQSAILAILASHRDPEGCSFLRMAAPSSLIRITLTATRLMPGNGADIGPVVPKLPRPCWSNTIGILDSSECFQSAGVNAFELIAYS
jgi:hypothetical protein